MSRITKELILIIIFISCKIAEAGRGGFLYICIGNCAWWQYLLMGITVLLFLFCCCAGAVKCRGNRDNDEPIMDQQLGIRGQPVWRSASTQPPETNRIYAISGQNVNNYT